MNTPTQQKTQPIALTKKIERQIVQEFETASLDMSEYFSGSLLDFLIDIREYNQSSNQTENDLVQQSAQQTIYMNERWQHLASQYLRNSDLLSNIDPFPRSSMLLNNALGHLKMHLIDRGFNYVTYCFESYLNNEINARQFQSLNKTIVNGTCSDLKHVEMNDENQFIIAFCLSSVRNDPRLLSTNNIKALQDEGIGTYLTVLKITDFDEQNSTIYYYQQPYNLSNLDFQFPIKFVGNFSQFNNSGNIQKGSYGLLLANKFSQDSSQFQIKPDFFWINFTKFEEMESQNQRYKYDENNDFLFHGKKLEFKGHTYITENSIISDYKTIFKRLLNSNMYDMQNIYLGFTVQSTGMVLCQINNYQQLMLNNDLKVIVCENQQNSYFHYDEGALAIHYEPDYPDIRLFLISQNPPKVTEFDVSNFRNFYIAKIFMAQEESNRRYIAQPQLTVNKEQLLLLMRDIYTNNYVIRVFSRGTSFFKIVLTDLILPSQSRQPFFQFPNYYFNKFLFRDERTVNISQVNQPELIFNRSEFAMQTQFIDLNNRTFQVNISEISGNRVKNLSSFNLTFIDRYNTFIFAQKSDEEIQRGLNVFYSCGDVNFTYDLTRLFIGPDYQVEHLKDPKATDNSQDFFKFQNSRETVVLNMTIDGRKCKRTVMMPSKRDGQYENDVLVLVCMDLENGELSSYRLPVSQVDNQTDLSQIGFEFKPDNVIKIPFSKIIDFRVDPQERTILALIGISANTTKVFLHDLIEMHYFTVEGQINWRKKHRIGKQTFTFNSSENIFSYCPTFKKGIFSWNNEAIDPQTNQTYLNVTLLIFDVDLTVFELKNLEYYSLNSTFGKVVKQAITSDNIILARTDQSKMVILQVFPGIIKLVNEKESIRPDLRKISDFDYIDNKYLVLYFSDGKTTEVYTQQSAIELRHKMRLPKYRRFENFTYQVYENDTSIAKRDYFEGTLAMALESPDKKEVAILIYKLEDIQHNALYVANTTFSGLFQEGNHSQMTLSGDSDNFSRHYLGFVTDKRLLVVEISYYDKLKVNPDNHLELIEQCKRQTPDVSELSSQFKNVKMVSNVRIKPYIEKFNNSQYPNEDMTGSQEVGLNLKSLNLGLAISPTLNESVQNKITFSQDRMNNDTQFIIFDSLVQGYNLNFSSSCRYKDFYGKYQSCNQSIHLNTSTLIFQFPLDFTTSERQVHRSFPIEDYYFILDSMNSIMIMKLPFNLDQPPSGNIVRPMLHVKKMEQTAYFGCQISNNSFYASMNRMNQTFSQNFTYYLFVYQCFINNTRIIGATEVRVNKNLDSCKERIFGSEADCIQLKQLQNFTQIVYDIIDVEFSNVTITQESDKEVSYNGGLAIIVELPFSFSNILLMYNMSINGTTDSFTNMTLLKWNSASRYLFDTFKVNAVSAIPNSKLLIVSVDNYGAFLYHWGINDMIIKLNVTEYDAPRYIEQMQDQLGQLRVFGVETGPPYSLIVFTNYGLYSYSFNYSMIDEEEQFLTMRDRLKPVSQRIFRLPFKIDKAEIIRGPYGYAMMANSPTGRKTFTVKLLTYNKYSGMLSKIFRTVDVIQNSNCTSLTRSASLEYNSHDQLAISFICESRLRVVRFCLKPNLMFDFSNQIGTQDRRLDYNSFEVELHATNPFTEQLEEKVFKLPITIQYQYMPVDRTDIFTFVAIAITVIFAMILFLFLRSKGAKKHEEQEIKEKYNRDQRLETMRKKRRELKFNETQNSDIHLNSEGAGLILGSNQATFGVPRQNRQSLEAFNKYLPNIEDLSVTQNNPFDPDSLLKNPLTQQVQQYEQDQLKYKNRVSINRVNSSDLEVKNSTAGNQNELRSTFGIPAANNRIQINTNDEFTEDNENNMTNHFSN